MSRYINADALIDEFEWCKQQAAECNRKEWDEIITRVSKQPTVDAVPVVRCGECKRHEEPRDTGLKAFVWCNFYNMYKLKDGYCNCGERKDGERKDDGTTLD